MAAGEERPGQVHGGGGESPAADAEEQRNDDAENVLGAIAQGAEVRGGGPEQREERHPLRLALDATSLIVVALDQNAVEADGLEFSDLGDDGDESRGGRGGESPEGEGVGGDEEGLARSCGGRDCQDREDQESYEEGSLTR